MMRTVSPLAGACGVQFPATLQFPFAAFSHETTSAREGLVARESTTRLSRKEKRMPLICGLTRFQGQSGAATLSRRPLVNDVRLLVNAAQVLGRPVCRRGPWGWLNSADTELSGARFKAVKAIRLTGRGGRGLNRGVGCTPHSRSPEE